MKFGQTIEGSDVTKAGPVRVVVNVVCEGPKDGCLAVLRDVAVGVAVMARLGPMPDVSPVAELSPTLAEEWAAAGMYAEGEPQTQTGEV